MSWLLLKLGHLPLVGAWFQGIYLRRYVVPELKAVYEHASVDWMFEGAEKRSAPFLVGKL